MKGSEVHDKVYVRYMIGIWSTNMYLIWNPLYIRLSEDLRYMLAKITKNTEKNSYASFDSTDSMPFPVRNYRTPVRPKAHWSASV